MVDTRNQFPFDFTASAEYEDLDEVVIASTQVTFVINVPEAQDQLDYDSLGVVQISEAKTMEAF